MAKEGGRPAGEGSSKKLLSAVRSYSAAFEEDKWRVKVQVYGKERRISRRAFWVLRHDSCIRRYLLLVVDSKWFERVILLCILLNSILLAIEQHRAPPNDPVNAVIEKTMTALSGVFLSECILKVVAWGFAAYISDGWNGLDFLVVVSAIIEWLPFIPFNGLGFLRLFRVLRPLRSLNQSPEMKLLVNTTVGAVPRLGHVAALGAFIFLVFGIIGMSLLTGLGYRECHTTAQPELIWDNETWCWEWLKTGEGRSCGGRYDCTSVEDGVIIRNGYCGGHEFDPGSYAPIFNSSLTTTGPLSGGPFDWCSDDSRPLKVHPENDFVHFDHLGGAFMLLFQCMTMEGWTDQMYYIQDSFSWTFSTIYFHVIIIINSFFLLNVALAVVDEVRDDFDGDTKILAEDDDDDREKEEEEPWSNADPMKFCRWLVGTTAWQDFIMLVIAGNVVQMCLQQFPPNVVLQEVLSYVSYGFLLVFVVEMGMELLARGPKGYVRNPSTCFDGVVVISSIVETAYLFASGGGGSALQALRTLRLLRILNKFASRNPRFAILLQAMVGTAKALRYWLVLFILVLYIATLVWMDLFANTFQFSDGQSVGWIGHYDSQGVLEPWCTLPNNTALDRQRTSWHYKQWCIPLSHFDNFGWAFVTIYQLMTVENWNNVLYSSMRATRHNNSEWSVGILYMGIMLFGETLFLSLFLSMLLAKFEEFRESLQRKNERRIAKRKHRLKQGHGKKMTQAELNLVRILGGVKAKRQLKESLKALQAEEEALALAMERPGTAGTVGTISSQSQSDESEKELKEIPTERRWPQGYSWFLFPDNFPLRRAARWCLELQINIYGSSIGAFDSFILVAICLSTICMMIDFPLADPADTLISIVKTMDGVFAIIFISEMGLKWTANPVVWGDNAYFWSPGCAWNWLDAIVVSVSVMGFVGGPTDLKTLRILRAFRPLRVVKRLPTLRNIVEAIFNSMKELGILLIIFLLFLLIFSLVFMMYLNGAFYICSQDNVWFHRDLQDADFTFFTMPLCLSDNSSLQSVQVRGAWNEGTNTWNAAATTCGEGEHEGFPIEWQRATPDTPICVARCDPLWRAPFNSTYAAPSDLCPRKYQSTEELPHHCSDSVAARPGRPTYAEDVGFRYIKSMQASYVIPCGGSTVQSVHADSDDLYPAGANSCRTRYCPNVNPDLISKCKLESELHPYFCNDACYDAPWSPPCLTCRLEYRAACECADFCTPLMKDAALCTEQGGEWAQAMATNFDNIFNSMLTLLEISTTESWVDTMDVACAAIDAYVQPLRDSNPLWMVLFPIWILFSYMFLLNLGVGIIVDKFMEMRSKGKQAISAAQLKWIKSRMSLQATSKIFPLTHLNEISTSRRQVYTLIESSDFERFVMGCILLNTILLAISIFPELETPSSDQWRSASAWLNNIFAAVFAIEALLKIFALQINYFKDAWNVFDFVCCLATLAGVLLKVVKSGITVSTLATVVRIFRVARLLRLLRFRALRPLNKLFLSLAISLVKLANVGIVACLFLILYSILGVNLFSAFSIDNDTYNEHANFRNFPMAFITLFRAITGEAWPYLMHDLHKDEVDWFRDGSWCTPSYLFDTDSKYSVLVDKCLIDKPNACVMTIGNGWNPMPWLFWESYVIFLGLVIMNVIIAVILEGYEETKGSDEAAMVDTCRSIWDKEFDCDRTMKLIFPQAICFVVRVVKELQKEKLIRGEQPVHIEITSNANSSLGGVGVNFSKLPMRLAKAFDLVPAPHVDFPTAANQVLRLAAILDAPQDEEDPLAELEKFDAALKDPFKSPASMQGDPISHHIAAQRVQMILRARLERRRRRQRRRERTLAGGEGGAAAHLKRSVSSASSMASSAEWAGDERMDYLRCAARAAAFAVPHGLTPPVAG